MGILDRALGSARATADRVTERLHLPRAKASAPEPFDALEDETAGADALLEPNAAGQAPQGRRGRQRRENLDFRAAFAALLANRPLVLSLGAILLALVVLAATALIVARPGRPLAPARGPTREGIEYARRMKAPPQTTFVPRMAMEREGGTAYTVEDAIELGIDWDSIDMEGLAARNDAEADELFGAVR